MEKANENKDPRSFKTKKALKTFLRGGIPDKMRRETVLMMFNLTPM
jgi:hypothetical protein